MLTAVSQYLSQSLPAVGKFTRQIVPPVIATLIAAVLIAAYNNMFSGHLQQPRMAALHAAAEASRPAPPATPVTNAGMTKPPAAPLTETITIYEEAEATERLAEKDINQETGKDQTVKLASAEPERAAPPPVRATQAPRVEPKAEARHEPRHVVTVEPASPAMRAPALAPVIVAVPPSVVGPPTAPAVVIPAERATQPHYRQAYPQPQVQAPYVQQPQYQPPQYQHAPYAQQPQYQQPPYAPQVVQQPPPVIVATPPMVTVPDRPAVGQAGVQPADMQAEGTPARPGVFGRIVNTLKPSSLFSRAKEFGDRIEQAGNDILPNIRQQ